jgi:hypothetical protein
MLVPVTYNLAELLQLDEVEAAKRLLDQHVAFPWTRVFCPQAVAIGQWENAVAPKGKEGCIGFKRGAL